MKNKLIKPILIGIVGFSMFVISLILYINSFELYQDEWGTDISFNSDYIVAIIISIIIMVYGLLNYKYDNQYYNIISCMASSIISFYTLGVFFKAISKGQAFDFCKNYLFIGIVSFTFILLFGYNYIKEHKK